ncbi:barstar family protein [Microterricola viridarii]|uniref:barstar family protein n=1 Tax=Microterricola viridarii TaxID=412690 RepID=UPI000ABF2AF3|nr:barstar family protein [Microterricola viridarii]
MTVFEELKRVNAELSPLLLGRDEQGLGTAVVGWTDAGLTVRVVRGRKMRTLRPLFDEFAAALQFPLYFGENRDAFYERLSDLVGARAIEWNRITGY